MQHPNMHSADKILKEIQIKTRVISYVKRPDKTYMKFSSTLGKIRRWWKHLLIREFSFLNNPCQLQTPA